MTKIDVRPTPERPAATALDPAERPSTEQRKERARLVVSSIFNEGAPPAEAPSPSLPQPQATAAPNVPAPASPAAPAPAAAAVAEPVRPPTRPAITLAEDGVSAVGVSARSGGSETETPENLGVELIPEDAEDYRVLQYLARKDPQAHGKAPEEFLTFVKGLYAFQDKWMAEHKESSAFDEQAPEYQEWLEENAPPVDRETVDRARVDMLVDERVQERIDREVKPDLDRINQEKLFNANAVVIVGAMDRCTWQLVEAVNPALAVLLKNGEAIVLDDNAARRVDAADPIAHKVMHGIAQHELRPMIRELEKMAIASASGTVNYKLNAANPVHARIKSYWEAAERDLAAAPAEQQLREGKKFLTVSQKAKQVRDLGKGADREAKLQELENGTWTLTYDDLEDLITDDLALKAKEIIAEFDEPAKRKYGRNGETNGAPAPEARRASPPPEPVPTTTTRRESQPERPAPTLSSGSDVMPVGRPDNAPPETLGKQVRKSMFE